MNDMRPIFFKWGNEKRDLVFGLLKRIIAFKIFRSIAGIFVKVCSRMNKQEKAVSAIESNKKYKKRCIVLQ